MDSGAPASGDSELALAIARGERPAETLLYERFGPRVRYFARRGLRSADLAEDACSETFLRVVAAVRAGRLRSPQSLASFVLQTARHVVYEIGRRRLRDGGVLEDGEMDALPAKEPEVPDEDVLDAVRRTIAALSPRDRGFLRMFYYEELPKGEIARRLGIDDERVRLIKSRALQRFRNEFLRRGGEQR